MSPKTLLALGFLGFTTVACASATIEAAEGPNPSTFVVGQHIFVDQELVDEIGSWEALNVWAERLPKLGEEVVVVAIDEELIRFAYADGLVNVGAWQTSYFTERR